MKTSSIIVALCATLCSLTLYAQKTSSPTTSEDYLITCQSSEKIGLTLKLQRHLVLRKGQNGWQNFWGTVDYQTKEHTGTVEADIAWRKDSRPGYNALNIALMDTKEAAMRKAGIEGGSVGFGSIDSREEIAGHFRAKWNQYKNVEEFTELDLDNTELECVVH